MPHILKTYETGTVYGLVDPRNKQLFYIGSTVKSLPERLWLHLSVSKSEMRSPSKKQIVINSLRRHGQWPEIFLIEKVKISELHESESFWISYYKMLGAKLTNNYGISRPFPKLDPRLKQAS